MDYGLWIYASGRHIKNASGQKPSKNPPKLLLPETQVFGFTLEKLTHARSSELATSYNLWIRQECRPCRPPLPNIIIIIIIDSILNQPN